MIRRWEILQVMSASQADTCPSLRARFESGAHKPHEFNGEGFQLDNRHRRLLSGQCQPKPAPGAAPARDGCRLSVRDQGPRPKTIVARLALPDSPAAPSRKHAMPPVVIVAHGQPSDPAPAAADLADFALLVAADLPGRWVGSATLAEPDALAQAVAQAGPGGVVFPMFMAGGWFTRVHLPAKLRAAGGVDWQVLEPFGCNPALHDLAVDVVAQALNGQTSAPVLIAAHGSFKTSVPSDIAYHLAAKLKSALGLTRCEAAFIDQSPQLSQVQGFGPQAICLPFFAAQGGHVTEDIPAALTTAGFAGRILPPLGLHPKVPELVAQAITAAHPVCAIECRYKA
jgi:sirohydrochlorin ferrochelatase